MRQLAICGVSMTVFLATCGMVGCPVSSNSSPSHDEHDHGGHERHEDGLHGGHLVQLDGGQLNAEWTHDDESGKVTVYILDAEGDDELPIEAKTITISVGVNGDVASYDLTAVGAEDGKAFQFEVIEQALLGPLAMAGQGVEVAIQVAIGDQVHRARIEHHHHNH